MDMNSYLSSLNNKIKNLPQEYRNEILKDYEVYFQEGLLIGKNENDIARELGDVDFIAKEIISEYYIENSDKITSESNTSKPSFGVSTVGIGILNILIGVPFILSAAIFIISLYILDFCLIITPIALIVNLIMPTLPISFGTEILWLKFLYVLICEFLGYFLYKFLRKFSGKFYSWFFEYIINSFKFQVFNVNKLS